MSSEPVAHPIPSLARARFFVEMFVLLGAPRQTKTARPDSMATL